MLWFCFWCFAGFAVVVVLLLATVSGGARLARLFRRRLFSLNAVVSTMDSFWA